MAVMMAEKPIPINPGTASIDKRSHVLLETVPNGETPARR
jgi:hypothetical protein